MACGVRKAWGNALGGALTAGQLWNLFQPR
jgi:hypothetical protein